MQLVARRDDAPVGAAAARRGPDRVQFVRRGGLAPGDRVVPDQVRARPRSQVPDAQRHLHGRSGRHDGRREEPDDLEPRTPERGAAASRPRPAAALPARRPGSRGGRCRTRRPRRRSDHERADAPRASGGACGSCRANCGPASRHRPRSRPCRRGSGRAVRGGRRLPRARPAAAAGTNAAVAHAVGAHASALTRGAIRRAPLLPAAPASTRRSAR